MTKTSADTMKTESHNLEEIVALGLYRNKKKKIMKIIDTINEKYGGERKSIEEVRKSLSKIDGSMSDYIISERE